MKSFKQIAQDAKQLEPGRTIEVKLGNSRHGSIKIQKISGEANSRTILECWLEGRKQDGKLFYSALITKPGQGVIWREPENECADTSRKTNFLYTLYAAFRAALVFLEMTNQLESKIIVRTYSKHFVLQMQAKRPIDPQVYSLLAFDCLDRVKKFKDLTFQFTPSREFRQAA